MNVSSPRYPARSQSPVLSGSGIQLAARALPVLRPPAAVPYQSRHTYACWTLSAGVNPSFIATQMGHENAKMVYEIYSKWMSEKDKDEIAMLNAKML
ncbi:tyrosine-type recombinase/integrase [Citrobacter freundii]|nr:tyrosine-type recombinase/integrase [Citrobacter freundii]